MLRSQVFLSGQSGVGAIAASILVSGGFFAVAHRRSLRIILYTGAVLVAATKLWAALLCVLLLIVVTFVVLRSGDRPSAKLRNPDLEYLKAVNTVTPPK